MERILKYIEAHLCEPLTSRQLAEIAGYSEYHFVRLFKSYTNMTCRHYICRLRLVKAAEDIANGSRIIDTAFQYGWQSHSAFTKSFKREFGFSPSLLRTMRMEMDYLEGERMKHIFIMKTEVGTTKEELLQILKASMAHNGMDVDDSLLNRLYQLACRTYAGVKRYSGEEYVTHTLNVSMILSEMGAEPNVILAGMFCDAAAKGILSLDELQKELPSEIFHIVSNLKIKNMDLKHAPEEVIQVKLAERLHNMRTIDYIDDEKKSPKIKETVEIFMPLARNLGNVELVEELKKLAEG